MKKLETLFWQGPDGPLDRVTESDFRSGWLSLIDQTKLPVQFVYCDCHQIEEVWNAIKTLQVRGAPAIGIAAAYGVCVGLQSLFQAGSTPTNDDFLARVDQVTDYLATSRPTAVNLFWALDRMKNVARTMPDETTPLERALRLLTEAKTIHDEDRKLCRAMGDLGATLVHDHDVLLTHCNAGGLATADYGTALAVFFSAKKQGKSIRVYADETRPLLQGARLTCWELLEHEIPVTLICDSMAALVMQRGGINAVFVGADRIAANGDTANKIGTYSVAVCARAHGIPFYVVAPSSTFDLTIRNGRDIPIELRDPEEIRRGFGCQTAPDGIDIYNPAFDVTPARLITGIVTERGIINPVNRRNIVATLGPQK